MQEHKGLVLFSHGREGKPNGTKIQVLSKVAQSHGYATLAIDYTQCADAVVRLQLLRQHLVDKDPKEVVLVGSSMGGYLSVALANEYAFKGLFLLCPALYMPKAEYQVQAYLPKAQPIAIVHGWEDTTVPVAHSISFAQAHLAQLHLVKDGHRLADSQDFLVHNFNGFLRELDNNVAM
ncbi:MAG: alpha/beta hydrolase [Flavobacteriaceae bacterium]|nr:alpha/beta hydrolase [Flavobacteriaceae bacterium]